MNDNREGDGKPYEVGYGKPPAKHRFKKGQSGNPNGRKKGSRNKPEPLRGADKPTQYMILEEAYRPVLLREGDKVIELPAIQAVIRSMSVSAMKGNRLAQKLVTEIVQKIEGEHYQTQYENIEAFTTYKQKWTEEIERCRNSGLPDPQPLPHPDDVLIDYRAGTMRIVGPITEQEKARWDKMLTRRDEAQEGVLYYMELMKTDTEFADQYRDEIEFEKRIFDLINEKLPERYQKKLVTRTASADDSGEREEAA
ncbi:MAG: DUF5681 domain-containing protein [Sphingomicrobium sp.]